MTDLTARSEDIERAELVDLHAGPPAALRDRLGLRLEEVGGALVSVAAAVPSILINRTVGLGLHETASPETVGRIVDRYRAAGIARYFVQLVPDARPPELRDVLSAAGLEKARGWMKFIRGPAPAPDVTSPLAVRKIGPERASDFARIAVAGFDLPEAAEPLIAALISRPGWHLYMSFLGDTPAGTGAMLVQGGVAHLDWGVTHPDFRRRGGQSAVLAERIRDAIAMGCDLLVTTTGEAVPGDPQHSYGNILRAGFEEAYLRENWAPPRQSV
jgi:GNAT superfamily N-acetyltransferase